MSAFLTLLKREWLEARLAFFWFPVGALLLFVLIGLAMLAISGYGRIEVIIESDGAPASLFFPSHWSGQDWNERLTALRNGVVGPFYLLYSIAALFVLLGALHDERKDRSVLFWKSLPVSDLATVASKIVLPLWVAPLVVIACVVAAQVFLLALLAAYLAGNGLGDPWLVWRHSGLISGTLQLLLGFLIQGLWVLPVAAYLLLVSATASRMILLWALAVPVAGSILEFTTFGTRHLSAAFSRHLEPAALASFQGGDGRIMPVATTAADQLTLLLNPDLWAGVVIGAALICAAAWLRGARNEL